MRDLPPGWATDLAVLEHSGSIVEDHVDHLLVRTPNNPDFHWGNCLFVTDEDRVNDAAEWVTVFQSAFPEANWVAIGLIRLPDDHDAWVAQGLDLELDDVLTTSALPRQTPIPDGYTVRRLGGTDWEKSVARDVAKNLRTNEYETQSHERFAQAKVTSQRVLSDRDVGARFGAFADDLLVADLGIVRCGTTARYQSVGTDDSTAGAGSPPTSSALPLGGPPTKAATDGSSSLKPRTRPHASTAAWASSLTSATPGRTASRHGKTRLASTPDQGTPGIRHERESRKRTPGDTPLTVSATFDRGQITTGGTHESSYGPVGHGPLPPPTSRHAPVRLPFCSTPAAASVSPLITAR